MITTNYGEHTLRLPHVSVEAREEDLMAKAQSVVGENLSPNDRSVDLIIARNVHSVVTQMRRLDKNDSLGRIIDRKRPTPGVKGGPSSPLLELEGIFPIRSEAANDDATMIDSFAVVVPRHDVAKKETLTIQRQLVNTGACGKEPIVDSLEVTVSGGKYGAPVKVAVTSKEGAETYQHRINHAYRLYMERSEEYPWLKAYSVMFDEDKSIFLQMKRNIGIEITQALTAAGEAEQAGVLDDIERELKEQKKWDYGNERGKYMALGVLLGAKSVLGVR